MSGTMRALSFNSPGNMELITAPIPEIKAGELLVKVHFAGVCGTDLRIFRGTKVIKGPRITGHEFAGVVAEVGDGVSEFRVGDRVVVYPVITCGRCYACQSGRPNICLNRVTIGYELDGGFAEYVGIPAEAVKGGNVIPLPEGLSFEEGAASEPVTAALHGVLRSKLGPGQTVAIFGAGPIGLYHIQLARWKGASKIAVSEPQAHRQAMAQKFGADVVVAPERAHDAIMAMTVSEGVDVAFIDVGIPAIINQALGVMKKGGTCVLFAGCPVGSKAEIDPNVIHYREINFIGSSASTPHNLKTVLELAAAGKLNLKDTIANVLPLEQWQEAFLMKENFSGLKTLLKP